jgi:transcriptional regulator with XRE-family HTH domain
MPRRREPDPLAQQIGGRVRQLRTERGLTLEKLAYESDLGSKGHLSDLEKGLVIPTVRTLSTLAKHLGVLIADLVIDPDADDRQLLIDRTRGLTTTRVKAILRETRGSTPGSAPRR